MTLSDFIDAQGLTAAEFGGRIGVSRGAVLRYATGERIPRAEIMAKIFGATGGAVAPNDFYDLPEGYGLPEGEAPQSAEHEA